LSCLPAGRQVVLHKNNLQRELSFLPFFCGKRKVGKPAVPKINKSNQYGLHLCKFSSILEMVIELKIQTISGGPARRKLACPVK